MKTNYKLYGILLYFFKEIPYNLFISIVSTLIAQVFLILAYFLPLKVIILLNMDTLPEYITLYLPGYKKNEIILILTFLILIFYGISTIIDKCNENLLFNSMKKFIGKKSSSINPQNKLVYKFTNSFFKFISTFILLSLIHISLLYIFPEVALFITIYIFLTYYIFQYKDLNENKYNSFLKTASGIGFMLSFIYEVLHILYIDQEKSTLVIIVLTTVFARYIFVRGHYMMNQLIFVHSNIENFHKRIEKLSL